MTGSARTRGFDGPPAEVNATTIRNLVVTPIGQESAKMFLRQRYQKIQALPACGADESLKVGIRPRCSSRHPQRPDTHPVWCK